MARVLIPFRALSVRGLPPVCVVTGETENVAFHKVTFQTAAGRHTYLGHLVLRTFFYRSIVTNETSLMLPFSEEAHSRWHNSQLVGGIATFVAILCLLATFIVPSHVSVFSGWYLRAGATTVIFAVVGLAFTIDARRRGPTVLQMDGESIEIQFPSVAAAEAFATQLAISTPASARPAPRPVPTPRPPRTIVVGEPCGLHADREARAKCSRCGVATCRDCDFRVGSDPASLCGRCFKKAMRR